MDADPNSFPLGKYAIAPPNTPAWLRTFPTKPVSVPGWRVENDERLVDRLADQVGEDNLEALTVPWGGVQYVEIYAPYTDVTYDRYYRRSRRKDAKRHKAEFTLWRDPLEYEEEMVRLVGGWALQVRTGYRSGRSRYTRTRRHGKRRARRYPVYEKIHPDHPEYVKRLYAYSTPLQNYVQIRHNGSPVWWTDLDRGPVQAVTLRDLVAKTQPMKARNGRELWMMSLDQWDNVTWPSESQGGPPYTEHVSVARENPMSEEQRQGYYDQPPKEDVYVTQVERPKAAPLWLTVDSTGDTHVAVRIDMNTIEEILRVDGVGERQTHGFETPEQAIERSATWIVNTLEGNQGGSVTTPKEAYASALRYFRPRARFVRYGSGKLKPRYGLWAGMSLSHKETIRELLLSIHVLYEGSTVWLYDLETMKPDRVLTMWELIQDGPIVSGTLKNDGWYTTETSLRQGAKYFDAKDQKFLWPMSEAQWESGEWPQESSGGPPAARYGMEAQENPIAQEGGAGLICMGREVEIDLRKPAIGSGSNSKSIVPPRDAGMLYDGSGTYWPKCSLLIAEFDRGETESDEGSDYFGRDATVFEGNVDLPPMDLAAWHALGEVDQVFYDRAGTKYPGFFRHKFNKPRGLWKLIWPFKRGSKSPVLLYSLWRRKTEQQFYRIELPAGCIVDDRGIAVP